MMTEHKRLRNSLKTKMLEIMLLKTLISSVFFYSTENKLKL